MPVSFSLVIEQLVPFELAHQFKEPRLLSPRNEFLERLCDGGLAAHRQSELDQFGINR